MHIERPFSPQSSFVSFSPVMSKHAGDDSDSDQQTVQPGVASTGTAATATAAAANVEVQAEADAKTTACKGKRKAAKIDLATALSGEPAKSKHRQSLKELKEEKDRVQAEQRAAVKKLRLATQRQKRLKEKANALSNEDLLEIFNQRRENQELVKKGGREGKGEE